MTAPGGKTSAAGRRIFDLVAAAVGVLALAPFAAAVCMAIMLETGRPMLFSQPRLGRNGRPFLMYKFRKFRVDCGSADCPVTVDGDARMTRVGRFLAATKLDELPQLWNVLKGEMSVVGPRPESLAFADCFVGRFAALLDHKPGLVGPCQVLFRREGGLYPAGADPERFYRDVLFPTKSAIDLEYFPRRGLFADLCWVVLALLAVVAADRLVGGDKRDRFVAQSIRERMEAHGGVPHEL
jgi:lipopolysaccharide/colanic/teichoic acid biosynthesis glycosyltransferase